MVPHACNPSTWEAERGRPLDYAVTLLKKKGREKEKGTNEERREGGGKEGRKERMKEQRKKEAMSLLGHTCDPNAGKVEDPWGSMASQPSLLDKFQTSERPCLQREQGLRVRMVQ